MSCSFLNLATAKKCRMCSTKNYQARLSPPTASAPAPSPTVAAAMGLAGGGTGGSCESVVQGETRRAIVLLLSFRYSDFSIRHQLELRQLAYSYQWKAVEELCQDH